MTTRLLCLLPFLLLACGGRTADVSDLPIDASPAVEEIPAGQTIVFEADYQNWAWGYDCSGVFVTADGVVHSYECKDVTPKDAARRKAGMTEKELLESYGATKVVGNVAKALLAEKYGLLASAEKGALLRESLCADAGQRTFRAFRFDGKTYAPITLGAHGDNAALDTEPSGVALVQWLVSVAGGGAESCAPMARVSCVGCASSASCDKSWQTRACDGRCVSPPLCAQVASCAACGAPYHCVLDGGGRAHCTYPSCTPETCDCAGDALCASGKAWCKGSASEGFRCEKP